MTNYPGGKLNARAAIISSEFRHLPLKQRKVITPSGPGAPGIHLSPSQLHLKALPQRLPPNQRPRLFRRLARFSNGWEISLRASASRSLLAARFASGTHRKSLGSSSDSVYGKTVH